MTTLEQIQFPINEPVPEITKKGNPKLTIMLTVLILGTTLYYWKYFKAENKTI